MRMAWRKRIDLLQKIADEELLNQVAEGNEEAFEILVTRWERRMRGTIVRVLENEDLADEALNEAFARIWERPLSFKHSWRGSFQVWILWHAKCVAIEIIRVILNRRRLNREVFRGSGWATDKNSGFLRPDQILELRESEDDRFSVLNRELNRLSEIQRRALEIHHMQGVSCQDIADREGISLTAAKSRVSDGIKTLRKRLSLQSR